MDVITYIDTTRVHKSWYDICVYIWTCICHVCSFWRFSLHRMTVLVQQNSSNNGLLSDERRGPSLSFQYDRPQCSRTWILLPGKLTCPLKINGWKMYFLLKWSLLGDMLVFPNTWWGHIWPPEIIPQTPNKNTLSNTYLFGYLRGIWWDPKWD